LTSRIKQLGTSSLGWDRNSFADANVSGCHPAQRISLERANAARSRLFDAQRDRFVAHIDDYILGTTVLNEEQDKAAKTYSVVIRADINSTRLMNDLGNGSAPASAVAATGHGTITFPFLARSQSSVQHFDNRVDKRTDSTIRRPDRRMKASPSRVIPAL
jgi:hypothetical protein